MQLHDLAALLALPPTPGMPAATSAQVPSWAATQGIASYTPPYAPFPLLPTTPALLFSHTQPKLALLEQLLSLRYPATHPIHGATLTSAGTVSLSYTRPLATLAAHPPGSAACWLFYLPPLAPAADLHGFTGLQWVVARLLGPDGCPWDVRQTHQSLRNALLEETYEVLEALDANDLPALAEELGDLLISILGHSEMARQAGHFSLETVLAGVTTKLIGRHPHVFGALALDHPEQILHNWEQIKAQELAQKGKVRSSALDGIPSALPALATAQKLGKKAARTGFAWPTITQVWAKVDEELDELRSAIASNDPAAIQDEFGDLLFVLVRLAAWLEVDAETALREANQKFRRRFTTMEQHVAAQGQRLQDLDLPQLKALWNEVKQIS
jgi:tetrapyrrole methylase family protein/MazG family protein